MQTCHQVILNKYITDYNYYYPNNNKIVELIDNLHIDKTQIENTILINKVYLILKTIKLNKIIKYTVYLKSITEAEQFLKIIKTFNIYFDLNIKLNDINYQTIVLKNKSINDDKYIYIFIKYPYIR